MTTSVLLINPRMCSQETMRMPLTLLALSAVLGDRYPHHMLDGNLLPDLAGTVASLLASAPGAAVAGISVMPGPQVAPAIEVSRLIRRLRPDVPIVWGGYFPSMYPDSAVNASYVDVAVRGPGEDALLELLAVASQGGLRPGAMDTAALQGVAGISWAQAGAPIHTPARPFRSPDSLPLLPYERLPDLGRWMKPTFLGRRTASYQAAIGCRYRCGFCGVVSVYGGQTRLQGVDRVVAETLRLKHEFGADALQFYDNNFFDSGDSALAMLEGLARVGLPWWCYARADTMAKFPAQTWEKVRRSGMKMAYIGAESASDEVLKSMKKGSRVEHTLEVAARCREIGVIPEFSFVLGGPEDPEGEIDRTLSFVRRVKAAHPESEIILYFYSPTPQRDRALTGYGPGGPPLPTTPEEWAQPKWVEYVCHQDAPWLAPQVRQKILDFSRVLACRFPTVQDHRLGPRRRRFLQALAGWRYDREYYANAWELEAARRLLRLKRPEREGL